ncbi:MAG: hypothetical protein KDK39_03215 [Leptospiraceae bacterium]|nr:hypothetical protein [Leptospiraceae bacterium]
MNPAEKQRQEEYTAYYKARMQKYEGNPMYVNSWQTEKALYELMRDAQSKAEYQEKFFSEKLNIKNAIALVKDQETARLQHYESIKEDIRAQGCAAILAEVDSYESEADLSTRIPKLQQANSKAVSIDGFTDHFYSDFLVLEHIEVARRAAVPSRWKAELDDYVRTTIAEGRRDWQEQVTTNARQWDPEWQFDYDLIHADRHRRRIPVPDSEVAKRIKEHKEYRGLA